MACPPLEAGIICGVVFQLLCGKFSIRDSKLQCSNSLIKSGKDKYCQGKAGYQEGKANLGTFSCLRVEFAFQN
jgi:hypothetical protein